VSPEHLEANAALAVTVQEIADANGATPAQVALAWLLAQRPWIVPIPGTKRIRYVEDNAGATGLELSAADRERLEELAAGVAGARYDSEARNPTWTSPPLSA
jgi:aryl-alcohol dehydrogenase-like predicted oxidoreductase